MNDPYVQAHNLGRAYPRGRVTVEALAGASCRVCPGERIAIVGPSGSGKSTLLHLMGGLDTPTSGTISWPALGARKILRPEKIAFVFQVQSLLPALSVVENVELPLLLSRSGKERATEAAMDALTRIELADLADKLPEEISGGQAQRVAVARALAYRPKLILADEPTGQLDHATAMHLFDALLAALEGSDSALVVATHDRSVAERMDRHWTMRFGKLDTGAATTGVPA